MSDQLLTNVSIGFVMEPEDIWQVHSVVSLDKLAYGKTGSCYVCLQYIGDGVYPIVQLGNVEVCCNVGSSLRLCRFASIHSTLVCVA